MKSFVLLSKLLGLLRNAVLHGQLSLSPTDGAFDRCSL